MWHLHWTYVELDGKCTCNDIIKVTVSSKYICLYCLFYWRDWGSKRKIPIYVQRALVTENQLGGGGGGRGGPGIEEEDTESREWDTLNVKKKRWKLLWTAGHSNYSLQNSHDHWGTTGDNMPWVELPVWVELRFCVNIRVNIISCSALKKVDKSRNSEAEIKCPKFSYLLLHISFITLKAIKQQSA